jgi:hypothetical protein
MIDLDPVIASFREIGTLRLLLAIQFVDTNIPEMRLSFIPPVLNSSCA